jgi:predicted MFS family arabinose efflux permease
MILLRRFAADDRGRLHGSALSAVTIAGQVSIVIGPTLGGLLVLAGGWRATIVAVVPVALCAGVLGAFWLPRGTTPRNRSASIRDVDFAGIATFAAGLTLMLVALLHPQSASVSAIVAAIAFFAIWVAIELRTSTPFIDVRMLARSPRLVAVYGRFAIIYTIFYAIFYGFPQWLEQAHRSSPAQAGLFMLPTSIVAIACATIAPRLKPKRSLLFGCAGALVGALFLRQLHAQSTAYAIVAVNAIFGIPNGMNPVSEQATLAMHADVRHMGVASGLLRTAGYIGAMLASALIAVTFSNGANDRSLQHLATILVGLAAALVLISGARVLRPSSE